MRTLIFTILAMMFVQMIYAQEPYTSSRKKSFVDQFPPSDFTIKTKYSPDLINPTLKATSNTSLIYYDNRSYFSMERSYGYTIDYNLYLPATPRYHDIILNPLFGGVIELGTELPSVPKNYPVSRYRINLWEYIQ